MGNNLFTLEPNELGKALVESLFLTTRAALCGQLSSFHWAFGYVLDHVDASMMPISDSRLRMTPCVSVGIHRKGEMLEIEMQTKRNENFYIRSVSSPQRGMTLNFLQGIFQRGQSCIEEKR